VPGATVRAHVIGPVPARADPQARIAEASDPSPIEAVRELRAYLDSTEEAAILQARELGASTKDIADALGITRQGAHHKLRTIERRRAAGETIVIPDLKMTRR
jgi:DNA-directed RNA polymerase specialized sigma24 family protein